MSNDSTWLRLLCEANEPSQFVDAARYATSSIAQSIGLSCEDSHFDADRIWFGTMVDASTVLGEQMNPILLLIQRQECLDDVGQVRMLEFIINDMKRRPKAAVLISGPAPPPSEEIQAMRTRSAIHGLDLVVADFADIQQILQAPEPVRAFRHLILSQVPLPSPYILTGPVPDAMFFGRGRELAVILKHFACGQSCVLIGNRRIGKTSLLSRLHRITLPAACWQSIFHSGATTRTPESFFDAPSSYVRQNPSSDLPCNIGALLGRASQDSPIVLLLDEADWLVNIDSKEGWPLFTRLRVLMTSGALRIVLAGGPGLRQSLQTAGSPLFNSANEVLLGALDFTDIEALVMAPLRQLEICLADVKIVHRVFELTGGHPQVVQAICDRLIGALNQAKTRTLTLEHLQSVMKDLGFQRDCLHVYWELSTPLERLISLVMAENATLCTRAAIQCELKNRYMLMTKAEAVDAALARLVELRLILRRTGELYQVAVGMFRSVMSGGLAFEDMKDMLAVRLQDSQKKGGCDITL